MPCGPAQEHPAALLKIIFVLYEIKTLPSSQEPSLWLGREKKQVSSMLDRSG